jgi:DNA-binding MarR family transcriptional regulator
MQKTLEQILNTILHSSELMEEDLRQETELKQLTSRQLTCIECINDMKNPSLSELAEKMKIAKPSISVMIDRLENNEFIYKVVSDSDRRSAHIHLTAKGQKAARLHNEIHAKIAELLTLEMTDSEKQILIVLLNKSIVSLTKNNIILN